MGARGEADLRAARRHFGVVTRALAEVEVAGRQVRGEPLLPRILQALDPFMDEAIKEELQGVVAEDEESVRDILVKDMIIPLIDGLVDVALEVASTAPKPTGGSHPAGMISVADFGLLSAALELLVLWGMYPHLEPGVGVRLSKRADFKGARFHAKLLAWGMEVAAKAEEREEGGREQAPEEIEEEQEEGEERRPSSAGGAGGGRKRCRSSSSHVAAPDPRDLLLSCGRVLQSCMSLHQYALFFKARHGADLVAAYMQVAIRSQQEDEWQREARTRLEAFLDESGPTATLTILRDLVSRGKEAPAWLRQECSSRMTSTLMRAGGVRAVLEAFLSHVDAEQEDSHAHMRVADLLASLPKGMPPVEYLTAVGPQIIPLFHVQGPQRPIVLRLAALIVTRLCEKMPGEARRCVLRPLLDALVRSPPAAAAEGGVEGRLCGEGKVVVVVREDEVSSAIVDLQSLLFSSPPKPAVIEALSNQGLVRALLRLYAFAVGAKVEIAGRVEECLLELIGSSRRGYMLLLDAYLHMGKGETAFTPGGSGAAEMRLREEGREGQHLSMLQRLAEGSMEGMLERLGGEADVVVQVMSKLDSESQVPGQLFERLLLSFLLIKVRGHETRALVLEACEADNADLGRKKTTRRRREEGAEGVIVEEEEGDEVMGEEAAALLVLLEKAAGVMGERVFGSGRQIIRCCRLVLLLVQSNHRDEDAVVVEEEEGEGDEVRDLASVVLGLLGVLLSLGEERREKREEGELRQLLPLLERMAGDTTTNRPELSEMAQSLQAMILTRGLTLEERKEQRERERRAAVSVGPSGGGGDEVGDADVAPLARLMKEVEGDLGSESPPVRARGICSLTKVIYATPSWCLMEEGNPLVKDLLSLLVHMLRDTESYVYLAAIQGLAILSERAPAQVIPHLVKCLRGETPATATRSTTPTIQERLRAGEALVLSARRCGEAMPKYAAQMVPAFVLGARPIPPTTTSNLSSPSQQQEGGGLSSWDYTHFRASCLSNLGEVCGLLGWGLQKYLEDVSDLALGILRHEQPPMRAKLRPEQPQPPPPPLPTASPSSSQGRQGEGLEEEERRLVRRGAVFLLGKMIAGAGPRLLSLLPHHLPRVTLALRQAAEHDVDDVTRFHASRYLGVLEDQVMMPLDDHHHPGSFVSPMEELTRRLEGFGIRNSPHAGIVEMLMATTEKEGAGERGGKDIDR